MALETAVQGGVHAVEQGRVALWVRRVLVTFVFAGLALFWLLAKFNGFNNADAMDQAQIARQMASGHGFSTLYARPLALRIFADRGPVSHPLPEINQAPLGPLISAIALRITGMNTKVSERSAVSTGEMIIAATGVVFLLGALLFAFWVGRALFDAPLALLGTGFVIGTALVWRFSISGLPQTAMMMFFNASLLCLVFALRASDAKQVRRTVLLAAAAAFLLGLVTLANGIAAWMFVGFLIFVTVTLRPRLAVAGGCLAAYIAPLLPWMWHNIRAVGQPLGFARYALMRPAGLDKVAFEADFETMPGFHWKDFVANTASQALDQVTDIFGLFGYNVVAAAFFLAVLFHVFHGWQAAQFRWAVLLMWAGGFIGMSISGVDAQVSVNQLHILFLPIMVFYGFGFLLLLWQRLAFEQPLMRAAFICLLFATVSTPLLLTLGSRSLRFNWPPYLPLLVQKLGDWIGPQEAMASDIPWATAWYAERRSLLLPRSAEQFELINSERLLGAPLVAIYLTPASGGSRTYADIAGGRYRDWARLILNERGSQAPPSWRLRSKITLPIDGASILLADKERWKE